MLIISLIASLQVAHGAGACLASFSSNLNSISGVVRRLSSPCWREAQKGEGNIERIMKSCSNSELTLLATIRDYREANRDLCRSSECRPELNTARLCVNGRSLQYYINQARSR